MINRSTIEVCLRRNSSGGYYNVVNNTTYSLVYGSSFPQPTDYFIRPECTIDLRSGTTGIELNHGLNNKTIYFWVKDTTTSYSGYGGMVVCGPNLLIKNNTLYVANAPMNNNMVKICENDFSKWTLIEVYTYKKNLTFFVNGSKIGSFGISYNNTWNYYGEDIKIVGNYEMEGQKNNYNFNGIISDFCVISGRYHTDGYQIPVYYRRRSLYDNIIFYLLDENNDNVYG